MGGVEFVVGLSEKRSIGSCLAFQRGKVIAGLKFTQRGGHLWI